MDGKITTESKRLFFYPQIYPTNQISSYGFLWSKEFQRWEAALNKSTLNAVRQNFDVEIDSDVAAWELGVNTPPIIPERIMNSPAFPFQREPAAFLLKNKHVLLSLAPGLGKSFCAIVAGESSDAKRILVISPLTLMRNWRNEIATWGDGATAAIWYGDTSRWGKAAKWVITNYDTAIRNIAILQSCKFDIIIIDESILVKNRKTARAKAIKEITKKIPMVWLLSGSPTSKFYNDLWMQLHILDSQRFASYWKFAERYCVLERTAWGVSIIANAVDADLRLQADLSDMYYARTQDEVMELPPWIIDNIEIPMSESQYRLYYEMEQTFVALLPEGDEILAPNTLAQMLRLIQFASNPTLIGSKYDSPKWDAVSELLEFEQLPAIVWTTFKTTAHSMETILKTKYRVASLTGDTEESVRQEIVDRFQHEDLDVIVAHPRVGKYGLTLTAARTAVYLERSHNHDDYYQSLHRVRRIGTMKSPHVLHLISGRPNGNKTKTIDHVIDSVLDARKKSAISITSGMIRKILTKEGGKIC
jgi:SNF2 family DNA or RNA helicase